MRALLYPHRIERHRVFQIIVSAGLIGSCSVAMISPEYSIHSVVGSTLASLFWLWE